MEDDPVELAAKDVFVLLGVPVPDNIGAKNKLEEPDDTQDVDEESKISLSEAVKIRIKMATDPIVNDVTPKEDIDYSSSDSWTKSETEENRWYNLKANTGLEKSDFESLKKLLSMIKLTDPTSTMIALTKLKKDPAITGEIYQNMFMALNGLEVLINILECHNYDCMIKSLSILKIMSRNYGIQCSLCNLDVIKPMINILLVVKNVTVKSMVTATLKNISKLRRGRKLIRLNQGIPILIKSMEVPECILFTPVENLIITNQLIVELLANCAETLNSLCKSLKSQKELWQCGFIKLVPLYLKTSHHKIQIYTISLLAECCRSRPNTVGLKPIFKLALRDNNILPQIIRLMMSGIPKIAEKAAETILYMFGDDNCIHDTLLKHKGMKTIFEAIRKFQTGTEQRVMVIFTTVLWKSSMDKRCREIIKDKFLDELLALLSYPSDDQVISNAVATSTELWKLESLRPILRLRAIPCYLELLRLSQHDLILTFVCTALRKTSNDPESMEIINKAHGFQMVLGLLPSLDIDEFDKYDDFFCTEMIIAATDCLTAMIRNMPNMNHFKRMYKALCDLVNLLTHNNLDILAAACGLIEVVAAFDDNLMFMIDAGVIENLTKLLPTTNNNLRANLCKALGKCCRTGTKGRKMCCKNIIEQLVVYLETSDQTVKNNIPLALSGLSADPINCVKIEILGFIPFLRKCMKSKNSEMADAASICMQNVRQVCSGIGQYRDCVTKSTLTEI